MLEPLGKALPLRHKLAKVGIEFGNPFAFSNGANNDTKIVRLDALKKATKAIALLTPLDFLRNRDTVDKGVNTK